MCLFQCFGVIKKSKTGQKVVPRSKSKKKRYPNLCKVSKNALNKEKRKREKERKKRKRNTCLLLCTNTIELWHQNVLNCHKQFAG